MTSYLFLAFSLVALRFLIYSLGNLGRLGISIAHPRVLVEATSRISGYSAKPILFNEDDHYGFDRDTCNLTAAIRSYASWGFFDYRRQGEGFEEGFQSVPADWQIRSVKKRSFFIKIKEITGY